MVVRFIGNIIIVIGVIWIIYGLLQYIQTVKMNNTLHALGERAPRIFRASNGKFFKLRMYVLAASETSGKIVEAKYFYTAFFFKPAKIFDAEELTGQLIPKIDVEAYKEDKVKYNALINLQEDFEKRKHLKPEFPRQMGKTNTGKVKL